MKESNKLEAIDYTDLLLLDTLQRDASLSNQALAERLGLSAPTCLRRVRRLHEAGLIEHTVAILQPERVAALLGHGLQALVEVTLERQDAESLDSFEQAAVADDGVQQCWRVSPGPDFMLVVQIRDMPAYLALSKRLFSQHTNVRNVKTFFATKRAKFSLHWPLLPER